MYAQKNSHLIAEGKSTRPAKIVDSSFLKFQVKLYEGNIVVLALSITIFLL